MLLRLALFVFQICTHIALGAAPLATLDSIAQSGSMHRDWTQAGSYSVGQLRILGYNLSMRNAVPMLRTTAYYLNESFASECCFGVVDAGSRDSLNL